MGKGFVIRGSSCAFVPYPTTTGFPIVELGMLHVVERGGTSRQAPHFFHMFRLHANMTLKENILPSLGGVLVRSFHFLLARR